MAINPDVLRDHLRAWRQRASTNTTPLQDKPRIEAALSHAYSTAGVSPPAKFVYVESPLEAVFAAALWYGVLVQWYEKTVSNGYFWRCKAGREDISWEEIQQAMVAGQPLMPEWLQLFAMPDKQLPRPVVAATLGREAGGYRRWHRARYHPANLIPRELFPELVPADKFLAPVPRNTSRLPIALQQRLAAWQRLAIVVSHSPLLRNAGFDDKTFRPGKCRQGAVPVHTREHCFGFAVSSSWQANQIIEMWEQMECLDFDPKSCDGFLSDTVRRLCLSDLDFANMPLYQMPEQSIAEYSRSEDQTFARDAADTAFAVLPGTNIEIVKSDLYRNSRPADGRPDAAFRQRDVEIEKIVDKHLKLISDAPSGTPRLYVPNWSVRREEIQYLIHNPPKVDDLRKWSITASAWIGYPFEFTPRYLALSYLAETYKDTTNPEVRRQLELRQGLLDYAKLASWYVPCQHIAWICESPIRSSVDDNMSFHNTGDKALEFRDGYGAWVIEGVQADEQIVRRPETQTVRQITGTENLELRRIRIQQFGWDKFIKATRAEIVDQRFNERDMQREVLYRVPHDPDTLMFAVHDPSTGRQYWLGVPATVANCAEAQLQISCGLDQYVGNRS